MKNTIEYLIGQFEMDQRGGETQHGRGIPGTTNIVVNFQSM